MNYVNTKFLNNSGYTWDDVYTLLLIKQGQAEELEKEWTTKLLEKGLIKLIKAKSKSEPELSRLRLDKKGKEFLDKLSEAEELPEHKKITDWLATIYVNLGKKVGNKAKLTRHIRDFSNSTDIQRNKLVFLCTEFINDPDQMEWSFCLEYIFWKAPNAFATRFSLENSRLWSYYQDRKEYFDSVWEQEKYQN